MTRRVGFSAAVRTFAKNAEEDMLEIWRRSLAITFDTIVMQWPVDTGYSRGSFNVSLSGYSPVNPTLRGTHGIPYPVMNYRVVLSRATHRTRVYANFTAFYAWYIENGGGNHVGRHIVKRAAQNWRANVARAAAEVRAGR